MVFLFLTCLYLYTGTPICMWIIWLYRTLDHCQHCTTIMRLLNHIRIIGNAYQYLIPSIYVVVWSPTIKKRNDTMYILDHRSLKLYPLSYSVNLLGNGKIACWYFFLSSLTIYFYSHWALIFLHRPFDIISDSCDQTYYYNHLF